MVDFWLIILFFGFVLFLFPRILHFVAAVYYILLPDKDSGEKETSLTLNSFKELKKEHIKI